MQFFLALRSLRRHRWLGIAVALIIFIAAFELRYWLGDTLVGVPFITLFPAILLAAVISGLWAGIAVAVLSGVAALYWFIPPQDSFAPQWPGGYIVMALFILTSAIQLFVIELLNRSIEAIAAERDRSAIMFQELQHRVANNMQFVSGLLRLQRKAIESDPAASVRAIEEAQRRLETMARVHRRLYDPAALGLSLSQYLKDLCGDVLDVSGAKNIVCVVETPPVTLDLQRLVTLSLVITEAITNSAKHAFAAGQQGTISIKLERDPNNRYALTINDDGSGVPDGFNFNASRSLGFRIMQALAEQLGGEISHAGAGGMQTRLVFPA